jgi:hypothetical protein
MALALKSKVVVGAGASEVLLDKDRLKPIIDMDNFANAPTSLKSAL